MLSYTAGKRGETSSPSDHASRGREATVGTMGQHYFDGLKQRVVNVWASSLRDCKRGGRRLKHSLRGIPHLRPPAKTCSSYVEALKGPSHKQWRYAPKLQPYTLPTPFRAQVHHPFFVSRWFAPCFTGLVQIPCRSPLRVRTSGMLTHVCLGPVY